MDGKAGVLLAVLLRDLRRDLLAFPLPPSTKPMWTVLALALVLPAHGLIVPAAAPPRTVARVTPPTMNIFKNAFANDAAYSKKENAGLSKQAAQKTITWIGPKGQKKTATVVPGQRLKDVARACGIPIRVRRPPAARQPKNAPAAPRRACARSPPPAPRAARLPGRHLQDVRGAVRRRAASKSAMKAPGKDVTIKYNIQMSRRVL